MRNVDEKTEVFAECMHGTKSGQTCVKKLGPGNGGTEARFNDKFEMKIKMNWDQEQA